MCKSTDTCTCRVPCERCLSVTVANSRGKIIYSKENLRAIKDSKSR